MLGLGSGWRKARGVKGVPRRDLGAERIGGGG